MSSGLTVGRPAGGKRAYDSRRWRALRARVLRGATHCQICGGLLDFGAKPRSPLSPSVDHIIPLSKGGKPYDLASLRPVHYGCNSGRGDGSAASSGRGMRPQVQRLVRASWW